MRFLSVAAFALARRLCGESVIFGVVIQHRQIGVDAPFGLVPIICEFIVEFTSGFESNALHLGGESTVEARLSEGLITSFNLLLTCNWHGFIFPARDVGER